MNKAIKTADLDKVNWREYAVVAGEVGPAVAGLTLEWGGFSRLAAIHAVVSTVDSLPSRNRYRLLLLR